MKTNPTQPTPTAKRTRLQPKGLENGTQQQTAQYIADIALELCNLAKHNKLQTLQGLLEVTFYEAFSAANKIEIPENEIEHLKRLSLASMG